jgi:Txe/YoeB family toxin of Txe-Axe toxin-antitoxin module
MTDYTNADLGIKFPLQGLQIANENDGWVVLKKDPHDNAFLSILFTNQFFASQDEGEAYIQNEIQKVGNDLYQVVGVNRKGKDTVTGVWSQYINNVTHLVYIGLKILPDHKGYYYMAVTNNDELAEQCEPIFLNAKQIARSEVGPVDKPTENKLMNHTLKYLHAYNSNWGSGGGTSTQKSFTLHADHSFRYSFSSVVSMGSMGGGTSEDGGWGMWEVQKNTDTCVLVLRWHLKPVSAYRLEWGEPGIIYLSGEKYLLA